MMEEIIIKRHHDEHWFDAVTFQLSVSKSGCIKTAERWKESYLSGDEWRFSYQLALFEYDREIERYSFGVSPEVAMRFAPLRILDAWPGLNLSYGQIVTIKYFNRGYLICGSAFPSSRRLFSALPSDAITVSEDTEIDFIELDRHRKIFCCQPACTEKPTVLYRIKKEYEKDGSETVVTRWCKQQYRHFCDKHKVRGDCGMEDNDANYELVEKYTEASA